MEGLRFEGIYDELSKWRNNYIDVSTTLDEFVSLKSRSIMLRDEVKNKFMYNQLALDSFFNLKLKTLFFPNNRTFSYQ